MSQAVNIVWFKRDLRIRDHKPLYQASISGIPTIPLYVVEPEYWQQPFASRRHWYFIHDCLQDLSHDLKNLGQPLLVEIGDVTQVMQKLANKYDVKTIFAHEETGNGWTYERDLQVIKWCKQNNIALCEYPNNGIVRRLKRRDDWSKIRNKRMDEEVSPSPSKLNLVSDLRSTIIPTKDDLMFGDDVNGTTQKGGRRAALDILKSFLYERGKEYVYRLSSPAQSDKFCSRLSPHLAWGTLSVKEVLKAYKKRYSTLSEDDAKKWRRNLIAFVSRLSWRCHFIQKIEDQPKIEFQCMHPAFEGMRENDHNEAYFEAWKEGKTGYPFVDACMRYLQYNGWITFRMRAMLVSFASYHLWIDWRKSGYHLAQLFTDYEPGIHYSQLQMQSGVTGINAIRIYSPLKQSQEHDPDGIFIKKWVPELSDVPISWIHEPWKMDSQMQTDSNCIIGKDYPAPIVDHAESIKEARAKIAEVRKQDAFKGGAKKVFNKLGSRKKSSRTSRTPRKPRKAKTNKQLNFDV